MQAPPECLVNIARGGSTRPPSDFEEDEKTTYATPSVLSWNFSGDLFKRSRVAINKQTNGKRGQL